MGEDAEDLESAGLIILAVSGFLPQVPSMFSDSVDLVRDYRGGWNLAKVHSRCNYRVFRGAGNQKFI